VGGTANSGSYVVCFLNRLAVPVVTVLHTVVERLCDNEVRAMQLAANRSSYVVVMTRLTQRMLEASFFVHRNVVVIEHGVSAPRTHGGGRDSQRAALRAELGWTGKVVIAGNGLIHPDKGYEHVIEAMPALLAQFPQVLLVIIGVAHSNNKAGQAYVNALVSEVSLLNLNQTVLFMPQYLPYEQLSNVLQAADIFVHPTNDAEVASSGTLSMAMACGLAPIATPFYYAKHILRGHRGLLMDFRNAESFVTQASKYLADPSLRANVSARASEYMRKLSWAEVGKQYALTLQAAAAATRSPSPLDAGAISSSAPS